MFKTGDRVRITNYGFMGWSNRGYEDLCPELVGKDAVVKYSAVVEGRRRYVLSGIRGHNGWYDENQLEELF